MQLRALTKEEMAIRKKQRAKGYVIDPRSNVRTNLKPKSKPKLEYLDPIERRIHLLKAAIRVGRQAIGYMAASIDRIAAWPMAPELESLDSENRKNILMIHTKLLRYEREVRRLGGTLPTWGSRKLVERIIAKEI
jgi:hypothetical protein